MTLTKTRIGILAVASLLLLSRAGASPQSKGGHAHLTNFPGKEVFSGELQEVTAESISIRLTDGRIIEARNAADIGDLSPRSLAGRFTVGDLVEITCTGIKGVYYPPIGHNLLLELN